MKRRTRARERGIHNFANFQPKITVVGRTTTTNAQTDGTSLTLISLHATQCRTQDYPPIISILRFLLLFTYYAISYLHPVIQSVSQSVQYTSPKKGPAQLRNCCWEPKKSFLSSHFVPSSLELQGDEMRWDDITIRRGAL